MSRSVRRHRWRATATPSEPSRSGKDAFFSRWYRKDTNRIPSLNEYSLVELRAYGLEDRRRLASTPKLQHHKLQPNSKKTVVEGMKKHTQ